jgi:hypothetical protein
MYVQYGLLYFILIRPKITVRALKTVHCTVCCADSTIQYKNVDFVDRFGGSP